MRKGLLLIASAVLVFAAFGCSKEEASTTPTVSDKPATGGAADKTPGGGGPSRAPEPTPPPAGAGK